MGLAQLLRNVIASSGLVPTRVRLWLLRRTGLQLGAGTAVGYGVTFKGKDVTTGADVFINHRVYVDRGPLHLDDNVSVGPGVLFATNNHEIGPAHKRAGAHISQAIHVGAGTWIGAGAVILGGVDVAPGCVIAAGAVVTKDTEPNGVYGGVPAARIKDLP